MKTVAAQKLLGVALVCALTLVAAAAPAQQAQPASPTQAEDWRVDWAPFYLWFSGLQGDVGAGGYVVAVDAGFSDVFSKLNIAFMTALDARWKRIGMLTDLFFFDLSSDQRSTPVGSAFSGFTVNSKTLVVDPELYGRLLETKGGSVDILAGARSWRMDDRLELLAGNQPGASASQTKTWVDPVVGARFRVNLKQGWSAHLKGDVGGFGVGSDMTWQIYTGVRKQFGETYSVLLSYRYLDVDYDNNGFRYDVHLSGLLAGFAVRFQ